MEYTIALGVWAVCIAAPCVMSWMAGDMVGSARTRRLYAPGSEGFDAGRESDRYKDSDYLVESWRLGPPNSLSKPPSTRTSDLSFDAGSTRDTARHQTPSLWREGEARLPDGTLPFEEQAREAERRRLRREGLAATPHLGDFRAHAEAIRQSDHEFLRHNRNAGAQHPEMVPDMDRVLRHYENSVHELKRSRGLSDAALGDEWPRIVPTKTGGTAEPALTGFGGSSPL